MSAHTDSTTSHKVAFWLSLSASLVVAGVVAINNVWESLFPNHLLLLRLLTFIAICLFIWYSLRKYVQFRDEENQLFLADLKRKRR